ncbi:MAG: SHOCT domain-containing protein [Firmicutes bacterium]|nr:SHOCT domain-containing protein [Bacillota bacterium]
MIWYFEGGKMMSAKKVKVKPGKEQSKVGFIVGLIFVLIGLIVVIPTFGVFGIFWTAVAAFIAYSHYKNGFTDEGFPTHEIIIDEEELAGMRECAGTEDFDGESIEERLKTLASLYDQGLISGEEYEAKRKEILSEI